MKWMSYPQMLERQTSRLLHQVLITGQPESLAAKLAPPVAANTRRAQAADIRLPPRRRVLSKQTLFYKGVQAYNQLDLSQKIVGTAAKFSTSMNKFISQSRSPYMQDYHCKLTSPPIIIPPSTTNINLMLQLNGSLARETVPLRKFLGK